MIYELHLNKVVFKKKKKRKFGSGVLFREVQLLLGVSGFKVLKSCWILLCTALNFSNLLLTINKHATLLVYATQIMARTNINKTFMAEARKESF